MAAIAAVYAAAAAELPLVGLAALLGRSSSTAYASRYGNPRPLTHVDDSEHTGRLHEDVLVIDFDKGYRASTTEAQAEGKDEAASVSTTSNTHFFPFQKPDGISALPTAAPCPSHGEDFLSHNRRQQTYIVQSTMELPSSATTIHNQPSATSSAMSHQNLLAIMPAFAFSMPAQIIVSGINIALISVLAVHLLFTVHYHLPLSRANWILQICSAGILLVSLSVHLNAILSSLEYESHQWPFMFPYLAEGLPPGDGSWSKVAEAFFLLMRAITTVIIHLTHIQFLTLLFPSALEARLILWMLGPLALVAAGMEFTWLSPDEDVKTSDLGDAICNICNSTLTLLYTCALMIWGGFVNRRRAWRGDGGTAAFGGGSMGLALVNTAMSFVQIRYDRLWWLPDICWTLTIWQSWLGFWWWVGAGMGIGEVEDRAERETRRRKRRERIKRKLEKEERQRKKAELAAAAGEEGSDVLQGIKKIRNKITRDAGLKDSTLSRRGRSGRAGRADTAEADNIELREITTHISGIDADPLVQEPTPNDGLSEQTTQQTAISRSEGPQIANHDGRTTAGSGSSDTNLTPSAQTGTSGLMGKFGEMIDAYQPSFIHRRMRRLRLAHAAAARRAATEQTILRNQVLNANRKPGLRVMMFDRDDAHESSDAQMRRAPASRGSKNLSVPGDLGLAAPRSRRSSQRPAEPARRQASTESMGLASKLRPDDSSTAIFSQPSLPFDHAQPVQSHMPSKSFSDPFAEAMCSSNETQAGAESNTTDRRSLVAQGSKNGEDDEDEWEEEINESAVDMTDFPVGAADSEQGTVTMKATTMKTTNPEKERRSWMSRNGLDRVRLRDRQRYE